MTVAEEAFEVGFAFNRFITSSHCYDGRDLARFFMRDDMPEWVRHCGEVYVHNTSSMTPKDEGIVIAKRILLEQIRRLS